MKKLLLILTFISKLTYASAPTSEIPERRDFPLSSKYKPCDDFHKYVCDEVESSFKLREDRRRHAFAFNDSAERILDAKKKYFSNIQAEKKLSGRSQQIKDYYLACMDESTGKKQELKYIQTTIAAVQKIKNIDQFKHLQIQNISNSEHTFIGFGTGSNQDHPETADIILLSSLMNLPQYSYYDNVELMAEYKNLIQQFFKIIDPQLDNLKLAQKADQIISFEKEFVKIYPHPEIQRQRWSEKRQQSQSEFLQKYPNIPFNELFKKLNTKSLVFNPLPESIEFLNQKMTSENLDVLKNFYLYTALSSIIDDSNPDYFNKQFKFKNKFLGGAESRSKRDERCTRTVMDNFPKELDQIMIPKLFPNFPDKKFIAVAAKIRESIVSGLNENSWLQPETKNKAILKIEKARLYLVRPENAIEWDFLPVQKFSQKNKIDNNQLFAKNVFKKQVNELKSGINLKAWGMGPLTVNAYYDSSANKFVMPLGILQYPFFNPEGDLTENLGAVGAVIGHELGHGIDDEGSKFDENGKLNQWMTMKDMKEFSNRGKKLISLFDKAGHNGALTLGENIGDLVGLTFAYRAAFQNTKPTIEDQKKLFIAYARLWCYVARPKTEEQQLKTNPHALGWARINEQVKHQKKFAEAFSCQKGDAMTLPDSEQVQIW